MQINAAPLHELTPIYSWFCWLCLNKQKRISNGRPVFMSCVDNLNICIAIVVAIFSVLYCEEAWEQRPSMPLMGQSHIQSPPLWKQFRWDQGESGQGWAKTFSIDLCGCLCVKARCWITQPLLFLSAPLLSHSIPPVCPLLLPGACEVFFCLSPSLVYLFCSLLCPFPYRFPPFSMSVQVPDNL